ncbi:ABC transporter permease [uncultured Propionibacterium sp.]|uniref:ABC transporter permease n=1 Tax=uncultured Propionibacterium sp. TaxID=218066 RepID=UPI002931C40E|nr:ABC transporter permease [uncultured Propionibacterium sp.]
MILFRLELRKLKRSMVTRVASITVLLLVTLTSVGGYAASQLDPGSAMAAKAAVLVQAPGWHGFVGLAAMSVGIVMLLSTGILIAWSFGREFTDGTIVGLFALPSSPLMTAWAKTGALLAWVLGMAALCSLLTGLGGIALGLPLDGLGFALGSVWTVAVLLGIGALPIGWVATIGFGYLAGIAAALGLVVVTNLAAGFGTGAWIPWAIPVMWATPGTNLPAVALAAPLLVGLLGGALTLNSWRVLELGDR